MDYEKLCTEVLDSDPQIRFTGILNSRGDLVTEKNRDDSMLLSNDEVKMSIHYTFERWNRVQNLEHRLGKEKSSITEYENVTLISLLLEKNLFLLSTEPNVDYSKIISKVNSIIAKQ
jgi:hypothetical protein